MNLIENVAPSRGNGVTILIGRQIMFTQLPTREDQVFLETVTLWVTDWHKGNNQP